MESDFFLSFSDKVKTATSSIRLPESSTAALIASTLLLLSETFSAFVDSKL